MTDNERLNIHPNLRMKKIILILFILLVTSAKAQVGLQLKVTTSAEGKSLTFFLKELEKKGPIKFYYLSEWADPILIDQSFEGKPLSEVFDYLFQGTDLAYISMYPESIAIVKDPQRALERKKALQNAASQQKKVEQLSIGEIGKLRKGNVSLSGTVLDSKTKEPMPYTNIRISDTSNGATTNEKGGYTLSLPPGGHVIVFSFLDYESKVIDLGIYEDGVLNIELEKVPILLEEVVIESQASREMVTNRIGQTQLSVKDIKRAPALMGEADLIKQVQTLPGVTTVGEAATGFNVRGGSVDQNLILYDDLPVFNSSHVFGFLSSFNSEALRDVSFYKGGIPAEYGGRASSVLDIRSKDGNDQKWTGSAGIGMVTSNFNVNGPITKEKTALALSFRTTYSNWLASSIRTDYIDLRNSSINFFDGTAKLTHSFSTRSKLSISSYISQDGFRLAGDTTYRWNNLLTSARLDHQFSPKLQAEFVAGVSNYGYRVVNAEPLTSSELSFKIITTTLKAGFNYQLNNQPLNFGWQLHHYNFSPGNLQPTSATSNAKNVSLDRQYSVENAFYGSYSWVVGKLSAEGGLRIPMFMSFGAANINVYKENLPRELASVTDTIRFGSGEPIKTYFGIEPRLSLRYSTGLESSLKFGYNRIYQFLHLVTNSTAVTPVDIWQPSGYYFKPQRSDQFSIGYFKDIKSKMYGLSVELYYKTIQNVLDFKDGAQLILNNHLETDLLQGSAQSYGAEFSITKNTGRFTWSVNYTYSRSFRTIAGQFESESINRGIQYPANFDQPNIINVSWKYNLSKRHFFTGNFTYHTGRPVTIPISAFALENTTVAYFSSRNEYRIPDYHRLDFAFVIEGNHKRNKRWEGSWVLSVYNVYGRNNPYTIFFRGSGQNIPKPYQLSIIGTIFPSLSYNIKF
jgi:hypothetical protein